VIRLLKVVLSRKEESNICLKLSFFPIKIRNKLCVLRTFDWQESKKGR
jgi:hypothetical protein